MATCLTIFTFVLYGEKNEVLSNVVKFVIMWHERIKKLIPPFRN